MTMMDIYLLYTPSTYNTYLFILIYLPILVHVIIVIVKLLPF